MTFFVQARDAAGYITLRRETEEAAAKKAEELEQMGYFEVKVIEGATSEQLPTSVCGRR